MGDTMLTFVVAQGPRVAGLEGHALRDRTFPMRRIGARLALPRELLWWPYLSFYCFIIRS